MLSFIDSFPFLISSLDSLVKNLNKDDFKHLSQDYSMLFDNNILDLVKQKVFYSYECMSGFEKFFKNFPAKKSFTVR